MERSPIALSVVIPAYNEEARITDSLRAMARFFHDLEPQSEILVVDDGSRDATCEVVREVARSAPLPIRLLTYEENRGKGYALKVGFAHSRGDRILFSDADLSTPVEEASRLLPKLDEGWDVVIGSRKMKGANIEIHQPWLRENMGKVFTWLVRRWVADVSDVTCGFKAFRGDVGRDLFRRVRIYDWSFDAEILHVAERRGNRVLEIPVRWEDREGTKVRLVRDATNSLIGLSKILASSRAGHYEQENPLDQSVREWNVADDDQ